MTRVWQESLTHTTHIQITFLLRVIQTGNPNGPQRAKRALGSSQGLAYTSRAALAAPPDAHGTIDTCTAAKSGTRDPQNSKGSCGLTWTLRNTRCATRGTQYTYHERRERRRRSSHQRRPRPAECRRGGRHGRRRCSLRHPTAEAPATHRGSARARTQHKHLLRALHRADAARSGEERAHQRGEEVWRERVGRLHVHVAQRDLTCATTAQARVRYVRVRQSVTSQRHRRRAIARVMLWSLA